MKTLACILHYNTTYLTDRVFEIINPYKNNIYDIIVIDNGSDKDKVSKYTTHQSDINIFFGGGLNMSFEYFLENKEYDSLIFLSSDLIFHGENFIKTLKHELFGNDLHVISPCILQPETSQNHWKPMLCWNSKTTRIVPWCDFQCPMFNREFIEYIKKYDDELIYGWGNDVYTGVVCNEKGWKIGVCDFVPTIHLSNATVKANIEKPEISNYNQKAEIGMINFFKKINKFNTLIEMRQLAENYKY